MAKESNVPPFMEQGLGAFKNFKFPGIDMEALMSSYQKNVELMSKHHQIAIETTQSLVELQNQYIKNAFDMWNEHIKQCCSKSPLEDKTTQHAEAAKETADKTIEHLRNINSVIAKSTEKMNESVQKRFKEGLEESLNMTKKTAEKR